jgi:outer membrane protein assembly factor BamB
MQIRDTMPISMGGHKGVRHTGGAQPDSAPAAVQCQDGFQRSSGGSSAILCNITGKTGAIMDFSEVGKETWAFPTETHPMLNVELTADNKLLCQDQQKIYSLNRTTGEKVWEVTKDRGGISDFAFLKDGTVFSDQAVNGQVVSLNGVNGREKWRHDTGGLGHTQLIASPDDLSLFVSGLMTKGGDSQKVIKSLDPGTGKVQWERQFPSNLVSNISISGDGKTCVAEVSDGIVALDAKTGAVKWENHDLDKVKGSYMAAVGAHGDVFFTGKDLRLRAIDGATGKQMWMLPITDDMSGVPMLGPNNEVFLYGSGNLTAVDGSSGKTMWKHQSKEQNLHSMGMGPDGTIYAYGMQSKQLFAIDGRDGSVKNSYSVAKTWFQSKMSDDGSVYYAGDDMKIHAIKVVLQEKDIREIAAKIQSASEPREKDKVELAGDWLIIGGVKLPVK